MKNLMISTALLLVAGGSAMAQDAAPMFRGEADPMAVHASDFIGMRVYASEAALDADEYAGTQEGWDDIGEINDVILTRDGQASAVLVDVGGFLGMGERQIAVDMAAIKFVSDGATTDNAADFFLVMNAARTDFEAAPVYGLAADGTAAVADGTTADTAMATDTAVAGDAATDTTMAREPVLRDGFMAADADYLTAEKLTGANVYDANDEMIGEVGELVLTAEGQVSEAIIDVGGFLGMGEKPVALKLSEIDILRNEAGDDVRIYVSMTKEQLEQMPTFGG